MDLEARGDENLFKISYVVKPNVPFSLEEFFYESTAVYETATGRFTSPAPIVLTVENDSDIKIFKKHNDVKILNWLIDEVIAEAEHRNDWINKTFWDKVKNNLADDIFKEKLYFAAHEHTILEYLFDKNHFESKSYKQFLKKQQENGETK